MRRSRGVVLLALLILAACGEPPPPTVAIPEWAHVAPEQIAAAKKHGVPVAFENDIGMRFVLIPSGTFLMGSPEDEADRFEDEAQREVRIERPFYMGVTEVTNGQYRSLPKFHEDTLEEWRLKVWTQEFGEASDDHPAVGVRWYSALSFAARASTLAPPRIYRLPTEAEWEFACRAGTTSRYSTGADDAGVEAVAWIRANSGLETHAVATKPPNPWGLHDMHGNVSEWCADRYYPDGWMRVGDQQTWNSTSRVGRGGHYWSDHCGVRCAWRYPRDHWSSHTGFRLVSPLPEDSK